MILELEVLAVIVMITVILGLYRIERGPTGADRMLSAMLFGTSGVALTLVLSTIEQMPSLLDMALVFAILASISTAAFVKRVWGAGE